MARIAFITLGCKTNQFETQAMEAYARSAGHEVVAPEECADIYVINTCAVTANAGKKSRQEMRGARKRNPAAVIAACGCYSLLAAEELLKSGNPFLITVPGTNAPRHFIVPDCLMNGDLKIIDCYGDNQYISDYNTVYDLRVFRKKDTKNSKTSEKPMIALTFDDGPGYNSCSDKINDLLEQYQVKATFFMIGENVKYHPKALLRRLALGCELGSHTWDHERYGSRVTREDIIKANQEIEKACGQPPTCFRSPGGSTNEFIRNVCKQCNLPLYHWSVDTNDWKYREEDWIHRIVVNSVKDGDIVLMHEIYDSSYYALKRILPELIDRGFQFVTCGELVYAKTGKAPQPGVQYCSATSVQNNTK